MKAFNGAGESGYSGHLYFKVNLKEKIDGIDVSEYQGAIDWPTVYDSGYRFAFARASLGDENPPTLIDDYFETNMENGHAAGMLMGAYHFAYPNYGTDASSEARHFLNVAGEYLKEGYLRPVLDLERGEELGKEALSNWVHEWMNTVKSETGIEPLIYVNSNYANNDLDSSVTQYDLWIAHWTYDPSTSPNTGIWSSWDFWQYSDKGSVSGISGDVDLDIFNGDMDRLYTFVIESEEPALSLSSTSYDFGDMCEGVTDSTTFEIWNSGTGTLTYSLSESCGWVDVNPTGGSSTGEHDTITVDIDTTGLSEGLHTCDISISSNGGSGTFTVTVNVVPCEEPVLSYSPTSHDFGDMCEGVTDSTTFELWNSGTDTLTYSLSESCGWVEINPTSGSSTGEHDTITVDIDTTGLSESSHTCDITISSNGGSGTFTTTVNIIPREPILCTDPDPPSHGFGSVPEGQTRDWSFDITNCGAGTLTWTVSDDQSWITVTPVSGSTTTETDAVTVTIDTTGLECGITHTETITVSSNGGSKQGLISVYVPEPGEVYIFITKWGSSGTGDGEFHGPHGIAVDSSGYVYVADRNNSRIQKFDSAGTFITKWGSYGTGDGEFDWAYGIAVDSSGYVYVADSGNHRIQKFDSDGNFITKWGKEGTGEGEFDWPCGIAVDSSGYVYVTEVYNSRIQKFDSDGNFITKWGCVGTGDGEFHRPHGIAVDSSGYVYVADFRNNRIQKFDSAGTFITKWGCYGTGDGEYYFPSGIAVDSSGYVYVADFRNNRIQKFDSDGNFITKWGSYGTGDGEFDLPYDIAVDSSGYVYVADTINDRIQKFAPGIPEDPSLSFSPSSHDFGDMCEGETDSTTFEIWNSGTGTLTYSLSETCSWVDLHPTSGSSTGEHDTITVDIDTTGLSEGLHTCDISISSNGGSGTFTVRVNIVPKPDLIITEKWLCWPDNCTICYNVKNIGDGTAPACHNTALYVDGVAVAHDHVPVDLAPGESYIGCFDDYIWAYTPPSDNITVCADSNAALDELDEDNNCLTNIWMCGDVNCDEKVTMSDVRKVFNRYLDPNYPLDLSWAADVNCDGKVTMSDVRKVFNRYLDPGYELNCCCEVL